MDFYFNNAGGNNDFTTLANWWEDAGFSVPASVVPEVNDNIHIYEDMQTGAAAVVANATFYNGKSFGNGGATLRATSTITFNGNGGGGNNGTLYANTFVFSGTSGNNGNISGPGDTPVAGGISFQDTAIQSGIVIGNPTFFNSSEMAGGEVTGNAIFAQTSKLTNGAVHGTAEFANNAYMIGSGHVDGDITFGGSSQWYSGSTNGRLKMRGNATIGSSPNVFEFEGEADDDTVVDTKTGGSRIVVLGGPFGGGGVNPRVFGVEV